MLFSVQVLKIIREDIRTDKVNLISARSKDDNSTVTLPVDSKLEEITISVNGKNPSIALTDSVGMSFTMYVLWVQMLTSIQLGSLLFSSIEPSIVYASAVAHLSPAHHFQRSFSNFLAKQSGFVE